MTVSTLITLTLFTSTKSKESFEDKLLIFEDDILSSDNSDWFLTIIISSFAFKVYFLSNLFITLSNFFISILSKTKTSFSGPLGERGWTSLIDGHIFW